MHTSLHYLSLCDAARLVRLRLVSPVELTRALLERVELHDGQLHAFITVTADQAMADARKAETEIMNGRYRGTLHGIPVAYKDNIETKGVLTTAHSRSHATHVPDADAQVVSRLAQAGAISLGKLSLQELAYGSPAVDDAWPAPVNPWNLACSPGGSSSGSGVAVAAGLVYGAVGTDTGGSIRHPAAVCGVVGMKPTFDLVSTDGTIPLSPTQDHVGPLTRSVGDNAIMLQAMSGFVRKAPGGVRGIRVGVPFDLVEHVGLDPAVGMAFETSLELLRTLGATIFAIETPLLDKFNAIGTGIIQVEAWARHGHALRTTPERFGDAFLARVSKGATFSDSDYEAALVAQAQLQQQYEAFFANDIDFIVSPGREEPAISMQRLFGDPLGVRGQLTRMYNLARIPALVMPMGFSASGLPLSLQIAGASWNESGIYDLAEEIERHAGWAAFHPELTGQSLSGKAEAAHHA